MKLPFEYGINAGEYLFNFIGIKVLVTFSRDNSHTDIFLLLRQISNIFSEISGNIILSWLLRLKTAAFLE